MANVTVEKLNGNGLESHPSLIDKLETLAAKVRDRAYEIFRRRGTGGKEFDDWLQAERDLIFMPASELVERNGRFEVNLAAPGFRAEETTVTALPDAVIVSAESSHTHEEKDASVHFCEFGSRTLYRRIPLPKEIDTDKVTAALDDGMLRIVAPKSEGASKAAQASA